MSAPPREPLVLASASPARQALLAAAGVAVRVDPAGLDEATIKAECGSDPDRCAAALAVAKVGAVAPRHRGSLVIGADQMLDCEGMLLDKPRDAAEARAQLRCLRGRAHTLHAAAAVVRDGATLWHHVETARLVMREFSDGFLETYIAAQGERLCATVGAYALEGPGVQLFERIEGDYFAILGLPLLPLLAFLRGRGAVAS